MKRSRIGRWLDGNVRLTRWHFLLLILIYIIVGLALAVSAYSRGLFTGSWEIVGWLGC